MWSDANAEFQGIAGPSAEGDQQFGREQNEVSVELS